MLKEGQEEGPSNLFGVVYERFAAAINGQGFNKLNKKENWLKLYGVVLFRSLNYDKQLFEEMFLGRDGYLSLFKPQNSVGLMWKLTLLILGGHSVRCFNIFGKDEMIASRFHFFGMTPNENGKIFCADKAREGEDGADGVDDVKSDDASLLKLLNKPVHMHVILPKKEPNGKLFYESLIQEQLSAAKEMASGTYTLDSVYQLFLMSVSNVTMVPPEYSFQKKKMERLFNLYPEEKMKYHDLKPGDKKKGGGKKENIKKNNFYLNWYIFHILYTMYFKIHECATEQYSDPTVFKNQFTSRKVLCKEDLASGGDFARACMRKYISSSGVSKSHNRKIAHPKFYWLFIKMISYAMCYWCMRDRNEMQDDLVSDEEEDEVDEEDDDEIKNLFGKSSIFSQKGVPLLFNILYRTKLKKILYSSAIGGEGCEDGGGGFSLEDVEKLGIMVRRKKRFCACICIYAHASLYA